MALGSTLASVLNLVKSEVRHSLSVGSADDALIKQAIETKQEWFASKLDWGELKDQWPAATVAGDGGPSTGRYIAMPTVDVIGATYYINFDRPVVLKIKYNDTWQDVCFGINEENYNHKDSDEGESQDPVLAWDFKPGDRSSFEVWPIPASVQTLRFYGQRKPKTLRTASVLDATKVLDLDDMLVALAVAVDMLAGKPEQDAKNRLLLERYASVTGANLRDDERVIMGGGGRLTREQIRRVPLVLTA